jgi:hypothetical protein
MWSWKFEKEIFGYRLLPLSEKSSSAIYHIPIKPMLGKPVGKASDVIKSLKKNVD